MKTCSGCGMTEGWVSKGYGTFQGRDYCPKCSEQFPTYADATVIVTSTPSIDGYRVARYLGVDSVEIVIGTGMFSEFSGDVSDFFGARATKFEKKLLTAKKAAFTKLKLQAFSQGGNAVIGVDIDYTEFTKNRIGVIANGTIVEVVPEDSFVPQAIRAITLPTTTLSKTDESWDGYLASAEKLLHQGN